jgi:hypothetical protein
MSENPVAADEAAPSTPQDEELARLRAENAALWAQGHAVGAENTDLRAQLAAAKAQLASVLAEQGPLRDQLASVGKECTDLRRLYEPLAHEKGLLETRFLNVEMGFERNWWQLRALRRMHFGEPVPVPKPPSRIPPELLDAFTLGGRVPVIEEFDDRTYPPNWPLIYTEEEITSYMNGIRKGKTCVYGTVDDWVQDAFKRYPIEGLDVVTMGSISPWYESMILVHGGRAHAIDYNPIVSQSKRVTTWTVDQWERERPRFDYALSISSFEHDGLGAYGDPLDPEGDLKAMRKMKEIVNPGGIMLFAVPTGKDAIRFNSARIYGRLRLPLMLEGWDWIDSSGFEEHMLDSNGDFQPVLVLRNRET